MKVKIYFKADKDRHVTVKLDKRRDVEKLAALVQSEIFRNNYLADLDYEDRSGLSFKIDGDKIPAVKLLSILNNALGNETKSDDEEELPKKKKKDKKHKKDKKKHKKEKDVNFNLDFSFLKKESSEPVVEKDTDPELDDNIVIVHRI